MGIHIGGGDRPVNVGGDLVAGDKTTVVIGAADHIPTTLLEKAEELVLDAQELAFGEAAELLKALRAVRKAQRSGNKAAVKAALDAVVATPGSSVIVMVLQEIWKEQEG